jgi:hypothetical protein
VGFGWFVRLEWFVRFDEPFKSRTYSLDDRRRTPSNLPNPPNLSNLSNLVNR